MQKLAFQCFGAGDGWPSARNHSAFLYTWPGRVILIDCGEPVSRAFHESGRDYDAIDSIYISHLHFDHVGGLFMLLQGFWLRKRRKDLTVYLPEDGLRPVRELLNAGCIFDELLQYRLHLRPLRAGVAQEEGPVRLTVFPTSHLRSFEKRFQDRYPQRFEAFSFLFESDGLRVAHSADIGATADLNPLLKKPLDLLVCEVAHVDFAELLDTLRPAAINRLVFIHLTEKQLARLPELQARAIEALPGCEISFARDGSRLSLA